MYQFIGGHFQTNALGPSPGKERIAETNAPKCVDMLAFFRPLFHSPSLHSKEITGMFVESRTYSVEAKSLSLFH